MKIRQTLEQAKRIGASVTILMLAAIFVAQSPVSAYDADERRNLTKLGVSFIDEPCIADSTPLVGNDNAEIVFNFFMGKGLSSAQASGIIGNLMQESGIKPGNIQTVGGSARGIAQWEGGRYDTLVAFAASRGKEWNDLGVQLEFLWVELPTQRAYGHLSELKAILPQATSSTSTLDALKMSQSASVAAQAFELTFERAGTPVMENRIRYADQAFVRFGNSAGGVADATIQSCAAGIANGQFIVYNQYDPEWRYKAYGGTTIGEGGCGPSAMAMIVTALIGQRITPDVVASYAASKGTYIPGVGSSWTIATIVAEHWGLKATSIGLDSAKIVATLKSGGLVVTSGQGALPFTSGGHYIAIRGVDADGKWLIGDSGHIATNNQSWEPSHLLSIMNSGNVYAITKQ